MKTSFKIIGILIIVSLIILSLRLFYNTNSEIYFIEEKDLNNLQDIVSQKRFKNKVVLVDLWFSSCGPCLEEFKYLPILKEELKKYPVEFLYLARDKGTLNTLVWKNRIKEYNLTGSHLRITDELLINVWDPIQINSNKYNRKEKPFPKNMQVYPHYIIIGKNGEIVDYDPPYPTDTDALIQKIKSFL